jgi:hypothetical protein
MVPHVAAEPPQGWLAAEIAPPRIAESAGAELTSFTAARSPEDHAAVVAGCVATPIPGWVEDMRPAVEGRTTALAGAAAERIAGTAVDARGDGQGGFDLRRASDLDHAGAPIIGTARTFVGFDQQDGGRVLTCFAACTRKSGSEAPLGCERSVAAARLVGSTPPPRPGLALRSVTWAVHHPRPAALGATILIAFAGVLAVVTRRRPRSL